MLSPRGGRVGDDRGFDKNLIPREGILLINSDPRMKPFDPTSPQGLYLTCCDIREFYERPGTKKIHHDVETLHILPVNVVLIYLHELLIFDTCIVLKQFLDL